jgi:hypothetical protein
MVENGGLKRWQNIMPKFCFIKIDFLVGSG